MDGWRELRMEGWKEGRMDGWEEGRTDGRKKGWMGVFRVPCPPAKAKTNDANWNEHRHNKVLTNIVDDRILNIRL